MDGLAFEMSTPMNCTTLKEEHQYGVYNLFQEQVVQVGPQRIQREMLRQLEI